MKLAASLLKAEYLSGGGEYSTKEVFRTWQAQGEDLLVNSVGQAMTPWSRVLLDKGCPISWRQRREANVQRFLSSISDLCDPVPLFHSWPSGHVPFNGVVLFSSNARRNACAEGMARAGVYCPVHWGGVSASDRAVDLASRILTIPLDQRYGFEDIDKVTRILVGTLQPSIS